MRRDLLLREPSYRPSQSHQLFGKVKVHVFLTPQVQLRRLNCPNARLFARETCATRNSSAPQNNIIPREVLNGRTAPQATSESPADR